MYNEDARAFLDVDRRPGHHRLAGPDDDGLDVVP